MLMDALLDDCYSGVTFFVLFFASLSPFSVYAPLNLLLKSIPSSSLFSRQSISFQIFLFLSLHWASLSLFLSLQTNIKVLPLVRWQKELAKLKKQQSATATHHLDEEKEAEQQQQQ